MSTRPKRNQAGTTEQEDANSKKTKKGKVFCVFNEQAFTVSKPYDTEEEANALKEQLAMMGTEEKLQMKEFKDETEYIAFKDAVDLKKRRTSQLFTFRL